MEFALRVIANFARADTKHKLSARPNKPCVNSVIRPLIRTKLLIGQIEFN